jgi:hypothetical protein
MAATIRVCECVGVSATTPCHTRKISEGLYEARIGIALLGFSNMTDEERAACGDDPFSPDFRDNFASGQGDSEASAQAAMRECAQGIAASLFE